jgi:DNA polymerase I-like protein with 3'-5' exonuclease and polymerase domains
MPLFGAQLILTVHDSLMFLVPESSVIPAAQVLRSVMTEGAKAYFAEQFRCEVPIALKVELAAGPSWGDAQPLDAA